MRREIFTADDISQMVALIDSMDPNDFIDGQAKECIYRCKSITQSLLRGERVKMKMDF